MVLHGCPVVGGVDVAAAGDPTGPDALGWTPVGRLFWLFVF